MSWGFFFTHLHIWLIFDMLKPFCSQKSKGKIKIIICGYQKQYVQWMLGILHSEIIGFKKNIEQRNTQPCMK